MEHENELVDMWVLQFETFYGKPNHKQENIKSLQYLHRQTNLCTKGSKFNGYKSFLYQWKVLGT
jgi:hypothetical protein